MERVFIHLNSAFNTLIITFSVMREESRHQTLDALNILLLTLNSGILNTLFFVENPQSTPHNY